MVSQDFKGEEDRVRDPEVLASQDKRLQVGTSPGNDPVHHWGDE